MQSKTLKIIIILFVCIGFVFAGVQWFTRDSAVQDKVLSFPFDLEESTEISIRSNEQEVVLTREVGKDWYVGGNRADQDVVTRALTTVSELHLSQPVSRNEQNFSRFEVDDAQAIRVTFRNPSAIFSLSIGKRGSVFNSSYIRIDGQNAIVEASEELRRLFPINPDSWRDMTIVSFDKDTVAKAVIEGGVLPTRWEISRQTDASWLVTQNSIATSTDPATLNSFFEALSPLRAEGFLEEEPISSEKKEMYTLTITPISGEPAELIFQRGRESENEWEVRRNNFSTIFRVSDYHINKVFFFRNKEE